MKKICILDYGLGNIASLYNSIKKVGHNPDFFSDKKSFNYDIIFIPGVGSFSKASELLKNSEINSFLNLAKKNSFIFGICLGMQILLSKGYENGEHNGLNFIDGNVKLLSKDKKIILPNVGYKSIEIYNQELKFFNNYNNEKFYFIHSYAAFPTSLNNVLCYSASQEIKFCSGVYKKKNFRYSISS